MFERLRKKKEPEVQAITPDVIPPHVMPNHDHIVSLRYDAKQYIVGFLEGLTRSQLMDFEDSKQFNGTAAEDAAWEAVSDEEWRRTWPIGEHGYKERIPEIVRDTMKSFEITKLQKQMDGIQGKLDRIAVLFEQAEVCMTGKVALKL